MLWTAALELGCRSTQRLKSMGVLLMCMMLSMGRMRHGADAYILSSVKRTTRDITCWTCTNKGDNEACNNWAPDLRCPINHTVCRTVHRFDPGSKNSVTVSKQCVQPQDCMAQHIGCRTAIVRGQEECVTCCDYSYCNQNVPYNNISALELSALTKVSSTTTRTLANVWIVMLGALLAIPFYRTVT